MPVRLSADFSKHKFYSTGGSFKTYLKNEWGKPTTKITLTCKDLIQDSWRNQKLFRQAKVKRIQQHQTSFTTNVKGTYIVRRHKRRKRPTKTSAKPLRKLQYEHIY